MVGGHPGNGGRGPEPTVPEHVGGDPDRRLRSPLRAAHLQHVQLAAFHGVLDVQRVAVSELEVLGDPGELVEDLRGSLGGLGDRLRVRNAGDDVLPLAALEELAVEGALAGHGIAGEGDTGPGRRAEVAEDH